VCHGDCGTPSSRNGRKQKIDNLLAGECVEKSFRHWRGLAQLLVGDVLPVDFNEVAGMQPIDVQPEFLAAEVSSGLVFDAPAMVTTAPDPSPARGRGEKLVWGAHHSGRAAAVKKSNQGDFVIERRPCRISIMKESTQRMTCS
jgi:hypothetical protein